MKNLLFLLVVAAFFVACSDDDDDNKGNNNPSGGGEITLLPKRVSKVVEYEDSPTPTSTYEFKYDSEGRIDELAEKDRNGNSRSVCKYKYAADKITMKSIQGENREETYTLQDGKASYYKFSFTDYEGDWDEYKFTYTGDYLTFVKGVVEATDQCTETLSFSNGNLMRYTYADDEDKEYKGSIDFTYGSQQNNLNIDLFSFIASVYFDNNFDNVWLLGVGGKRSAYLPESAKFTDPQWDEEEEEIIGEEITTDTFKYDVKDGYITKLTTYDEEGEVNWIWEIFYEE